MFISTATLMCICLFVLCIICHLLMKRLRGSWTPHTFKLLGSTDGPKPYPIFGCMFELWGDPVYVFNLIRSYAKKYKTNYIVWLGTLIGVNLIEPDDIETIVSNPAYNKKSLLYYFLHPWLGTGLLTSCGAKWHTRRKLITPSFHFSILQQFCHIFGNYSMRSVDKLKHECTKPSTDIIPFVTEFTLYSLCETTMGLKIDTNTKTVDEYKSAIYRYGQLLLHRMFRPWLLQEKLFRMSSAGKEATHIENILHQFTTDVINERLEKWDDSLYKNNNDDEYKKKHLAMLDMLISQMKNGDDITYKGIREEVDTFMFEGHDTTTAGISFILLEIANNKFAQDLIVEELDSIFADDDRTPTYQDLLNMTYLERCIKECLRLHPPVPFISRHGVEEIPLKTFTIPKNASIHIHLYDLHRNPKYWPDPERFDPDRFLKENCVNRHPFAYLPFSAGSRNCIGQKFAMLEMKSFVSTILRNFILEPIDTPQNIEMIADMVLRPKNGIRMKFLRRQ